MCTCCLQFRLVLVVRIISMCEHSLSHSRSFNIQLGYQFKSTQQSLVDKSFHWSFSVISNWYWITYCTTYFLARFCVVSRHLLTDCESSKVELIPFIFIGKKKFWKIHLLLWISKVISISVTVVLPLWDESKRNEFVSQFKEMWISIWKLTVSSIRVEGFQFHVERLD